MGSMILLYLRWFVWYPWGVARWRLEVESKMGYSSLLESLMGSEDDGPEPRWVRSGDRVQEWPVERSFGGMCGCETEWEVVWEYRISPIFSLEVVDG